jgi:hypothetical protein
LCNICNGNTFSRNLNPFKAEVDAWKLGSKLTFVTSTGNNVVEFEVDFQVAIGEKSLLNRKRKLRDFLRD